MTVPPDLMYAIMAMAAYDEAGLSLAPVGIAGIGDIGDANVINVPGNYNASSGFEAVAFS